MTDDDTNSLTPPDDNEAAKGDKTIIDIGKYLGCDGCCVVNFNDPKTHRYFRRFGVVISLLLGTFDYGTDIYVMISWYISNDWRWATALLIMIMLPGSYTVFRSTIQDTDVFKNIPVLKNWQKPMFIVGLGPYFEAYTEWFAVEEYEPFRHVRHFESVLESLPSGALQLYIVSKEPEDADTWQMISIAGSVVALGGTCAMFLRKWLEAEGWTDGRNSFLCVPYGILISADYLARAGGLALWINSTRCVECTWNWHWMLLGLCVLLYECGMARWTMGQVQPPGFWWFQIQTGIVGVGSGYYYVETIMRQRVNPTRVMVSVGIRYIFQAIIIIWIALEVDGLDRYVEEELHEIILWSAVTGLCLSGILWIWLFFVLGLGDRRKIHDRPNRLGHQGL